MGPTDWLNHARVATTGSNITLTNGPSSIDGVTLSAMIDRVLVKDQANPVQNGIYLANPGLPMLRASDLPTGATAPNELIIRISEGATLAHTEHALMTQGTIVVDDPTTGAMRFSPQNRVFNVCDFGAIGDGQYDLGTGTDNFYAITAALAAIKASRYKYLHGGAELFFPQGMYRTSRTILVTVPVNIVGAGGGGAAFPSSILFGENGGVEVNPIWFQTDGEASGGVGSAGASISKMGFAQSHPALQWGVNKNRQPGYKAELGQRMVPSPQGGGYRGIFYICTGSGLTSTTEPIWPTDMVTGATYSNGSKVLVPDMEGVAAPYEYTATIGGTSSQIPSGGRVSLIPQWASSQPVLGPTDNKPGTYQRPTDPRWTGWFYEAQNNGTTGGDEPGTGGVDSWPTALGGTVVENGVTWKIVSVGEERYPLLGRTIGQTTFDGDVTWTLTSTTPTYADNAAVWTPKLPAHGIIAHTRITIDDCFITNVNGDGLHYVASTSFTPPTNINGSSARRLRIVNTAGHGVLLLGTDSNACYFEAIDIATTGGYGIWDSSFLGNTHVAHQVATAGRGAYASTGPTAASSWYGCYSEQDQPPSRMLSPAIVIGGLHGAGFTSDCTAVIFSGNNNNWPHNLTCDRSQELWGYRNGLPFPNRIWKLGECCLEGPHGKYAHRCIVAGTSGNSPPAWNQVVDGTTSDGGGGSAVTWRNVGAASSMIQLGDVSKNPRIWSSFKSSTMANELVWRYRELPSEGNWPAQGWMALTIGGGNDQWTSIAVSTEQAGEGPGNFSVGGHKIYWWRGASTGHATPLPSKISEREAMTITNSTTPTTIHSYTPTDGQSFTGAWRVLAKQTVGTGSPKYAVWRFDTSAYRSGSSLIDIDALVSIAGSANPVGPECVMVKSGAAYEVRATGELSKTWVFTIVRETIDTGPN